MRNNLINARKKAKYTQKQIAENLQITERQYQRLEAGTSKGSVDFWERAKILFNAKSIDYLLEQTEEVAN